MTAVVPALWLPKNAVAAAAEKLPVREAIADWSAKWFAHGAASLTGMQAIGPDFRLTGDAVELEDGLTIVIPDDAIEQIGVLMFGRPDDTPTVADRAAIEAAARQALNDAQQRAAQLVGLPRDANWRARGDDTWPAGYCFRVRLGKASLAILVADRLLVSNVKRRLRPVPAGAALGKIASGLASHHIALRALVGECRLTMKDLAALSEGDVVVLDRGLTEQVAMSANGGAQSVKCRVVVNDQHLELTLV